MKLNCNNTEEAQKLMAFTKTAIEEGKKVEVKNIRETRSTLQNSALHLYFTMIATELNNLGIEYQYTGISGKTFEMRYTVELVKAFIWKPIQIALFDIESTTQINTEQMNEIIDVITKFFAEREIGIQFPSNELI